MGCSCRRRQSPSLAVVFPFPAYIADVMTALAPVPALADETGELLRRAQRGDHDAFAMLIEEHEGMVFSIARTFFDDRTRAEEIAQEVFLQLYRCLDELESAAHVLFWLRQVTSRRCID